MSNWKKDPLLSGIAKDIIKERISRYAKNVKKEIKPAVEELVELTKQLAPDSYEEIIESFYENTIVNSENDCSSLNNESENTCSVINITESWNLDFLLGNSIKHILHASTKKPSKEKEDLLKAVWYLNRRIKNIEKGK